ncbi:MAG: deoxyribonuclease V [Candidatus Acidiferrales bacterium]
MTARRALTCLLAPHSFARMGYLRLHRWRVTPREAARIQLRIRERLELTDRLPRIRTVAGADLAFDMARNRAIAGVVVYRYPEMEEVERVWAEVPITFPYVPGLLSFREMPALLKVFSRVRNAPDLIFYDGHGYAHPRRFGIACHLGVLLDRPTVGCAKSLLVGTHGDLPERAGSWTPLRDGDEIIGAVLRTRDGVNPIYVTQGHRISLTRAMEFVSSVLDGYRIPRPTRDADRFVAAVKRGDYRSGKKK